MAEDLEHYVLLWDGHCGFCRASRDLIKRWDRRDRIEDVSFREPGVLERFPQIGLEQAMTSMHVIDGRGRVYREEGAVRALLRFSPWYLRWMGILFLLPGAPWIVRRLYRWIAANRYRLSGAAICENDACAVHLGGERPRAGDAAPPASSVPADAGDGFRP